MASESQRMYLFHMQGGKCHYCTRQMTRKPVGKYFATEDHILPRSQGGSSMIANLVGACFTCNNMRGSIPYHYFKQYIFLHGNDRKISAVLRDLTREEYERHQLMYDSVRRNYYSVHIERELDPLPFVEQPIVVQKPVETLYRRAFLHQTRRKMQSIIIGIPMRKRQEILREEQ